MNCLAKTKQCGASSLTQPVVALPKASHQFGQAPAQAGGLYTWKGARPKIVPKLGGLVEVTEVHRLRQGGVVNEVAASANQRSQRPGGRKTSITESYVLGYMGVVRRLRRPAAAGQGEQQGPPGSHCHKGKVKGARSGHSG